MSLQISLFSSDVVSFNMNTDPNEFIEFVKNYSYNAGPTTVVETLNNGEVTYSKYINEYWTNRQRQSNSIHEISYRACFKPELPHFFISKLTKPLDIVFDPFGGRGTTIIEAALLDRWGISNDVNPLSEILAKPRIFPPTLEEIEQRLRKIEFNPEAKADIDLSMFYHQRTESELVSLRSYLLDRYSSKTLDDVDEWIRMVATNRLTGHSKGFFSVYTLPPNQAMSPERQLKVNEKRNQTPDYRDVKKIILEKSRSLLQDITPEIRERLQKNKTHYLFSNQDAKNLFTLEDNSINLTVTSPPFLDIVNYKEDNWLRCWFNNIDIDDLSTKISMFKSVDKWASYMAEVFKELYRVTKSGGYVAFEVGEVRKGKINLDEYIAPIGLKAGFVLLGIMINKQNFTKTSNAWGVQNMAGGTNTNRIVLFYKE